MRTIVFLLVTVSLTSCQKHYTCNCTIAAYTGNVSTNTYAASSAEEASEKCREIETEKKLADSTFSCVVNDY